MTKNAAQEAALTAAEQWDIGYTLRQHCDLKPLVEVIIAAYDKARWEDVERPIKTCAYKGACAHKGRHISAEELRIIMRAGLTEAGIIPAVEDLK